MKRLGERIRRGVEALGHPLVAGVRGAGLLLGVVLTAPAAAAVNAALFDAGYLANAVQPDVLRLAPPLILTAEQADAFLAALPRRPGRGGHDEHFLRDDDLSPAEQAAVLDLAATIKTDRYAHRPLAGPKAVAVIFEKPSCGPGSRSRPASPNSAATRSSSTRSATHFGRGESIEDAARVLSRYVSAIVIRTNARRAGRRARRRGDACPSSTPSPTGSTRASCWPTCSRSGNGSAGPPAGRWRTSVTRPTTWPTRTLLGGVTAGMHVRLAGPAGFDPDPAVLARAAEIAAGTGGSVEVRQRPGRRRSAGADVVATDTWTSMGQEADGLDRITPFHPYQVNAGPARGRRPHAIVLHCLPAHRGEEITDDVLDGPRAPSGTRPRTGCTPRRRCSPGCCRR